MEDWEDKTKVMQNKHMLRNKIEQRVYITTDQTKYKKDVQKMLKEKGYEMKRKGEDIKIKFHKLIVNG